MKILLLLTLGLLFSFSTKAEFGLGLTANEIKETEGTPDESWIDENDNHLHLYYAGEIYEMYYIIDDYLEFCDQVIIVPKSKIAIHTLISFFNETFLVIDDTTWKSYINPSFVVEYNLDYTDEGHLLAVGSITKFN